MRIVNEIYISDCITFNYLLNPLQERFRVEGHKQVLQDTETPTIISTVSSLPIKPDKHKKAPINTPSRTEGSDEVAAARQLEVLANEATESRARELQFLQCSSRGALDEAIEEAKVLKSLVGGVLERL